LVTVCRVVRASRQRSPHVGEQTQFVRVGIQRLGSVESSRSCHVEVTGKANRSRYCVTVMDLWSCPICVAGLAHEAGDLAPHPYTLYECESCKASLLWNLLTQRLQRVPRAGASDVRTALRSGSATAARQEPLPGPRMRVPDRDRPAQKMHKWPVRAESVPDGRARRPDRKARRASLLGTSER